MKNTSSRPTEATEPKTGGCPFHRKARAEAQPELPELMMEPMPGTVSRRTVLKLGAMGLTGLATFNMLGPAGMPVRQAQAAPARLPNIQYDLDAFIPPARTIDG